jgi:hypothetical protein
MYASLFVISGALHLAVFEQPAKQVFFTNLPEYFFSPLEYSARNSIRLVSVLHSLAPSNPYRMHDAPKEHRMSNTEFRMINPPANPSAVC